MCKVLTEDITKELELKQENKRAKGRDLEQEDKMVWGDEFGS